MRIDKIEPVDKHRSKVFIDGAFAFVLYRGELKKYHIEEGEELSESDYEEILTQIIDRRTRERALYFLKFSSRTETELRQKLKAAFYPEESIRKAVGFLKEYHFVDDRKYAENYISVYGNKKSRNEIKMLLQKKGIEREVISELLEKQVSEQGEEEKIRRLLEKRHYREKTASIEEKRKNAAFLMRKGFSYDMIRRVMGEMSEQENDL